MRKEKYYTYFTWIGGFLLFICLFYLSYRNVYSSELMGSPDETMRFDIPKFILKHGYLPRGDEKELIQYNLWGISYAFTPYLPSIFAAFFMKVTSFFTTEEHALIVAGRFVSVCSGVGTWYFCSKIGDKFFSRKTIAALFTILVCTLPQFVYLCTYLNNDAFSVFCSVWILYGWILGIQNDWQKKDCVFLGIGIGLMALTYYYAYAFILCSMIVYFGDCIRKKKAGKETFQKAGIVFIVAFLIAGWYFIRNFIIYNGDFLGLSYEEHTAEMYAADSLKPSAHNTPSRLHLTLWQTFFSTEVYGTPWIVCSIMSFIGLFGSMSVRMHTGIYAVYCILFGGCIVLFLFYLIKEKKKDILMLCNLGLCMVIPVLLSMYYSYNSDYQAQGRYFISALVPLMLCFSLGIEKIKKRKVELVISVLYAILSLSIIYMYIRPYCFA